MANPVATLFRIPELKEKILFTLFILLIYRLGAHVVAPGINVPALREFAGQLQGTVFGIYDMFVGGGLSRATVFALGIMPYISASIMFQLLAAVFPTHREAAEGGRGGPEEADAVHALRDGRCSPPSRRTATRSSWRGSPGAVANPGFGFKLPDDPDAHHRRHVRDVAG